MPLLLKRLSEHLSSTGLVIVLAALYLAEGHAWLDQFLPVNGQPLAIFTLIAVVILHEVGINRQTQTNALYTQLIQSHEDLAREVEVGRLIQSVNGLYGRVLASGDDFIDNEYTIKELAELTDTRARLGVNSYTQGRLEFLNEKVRRT